jgi:hypothetical protein
MRTHAVNIAERKRFAHAHVGRPVGVIFETFFNHIHQAWILVGIDGGRQTSRVVLKPGFVHGTVGLIGRIFRNRLFFGPTKKRNSGALKKFSETSFYAEAKIP